MSSINLYSKEITIKLVYCGPAFAGKTTSLQFVHQTIRAESRGQLISLQAGNDRTLYFDFLPMRLPKLGGYSIRVQVYTVPGQVQHNSSRKLVLTGADGIVFVADSQSDRMNDNLSSLQNVEENLRDQGQSLSRMPHLLQLNKRDLSGVVPVDEMVKKLNQFHGMCIETRALSGVGVFESLKAITRLVISDVRRKGKKPETEKRGDSDTDGVPTEEIPQEPSDPFKAINTDGSIEQSLQALAERHPPQLPELSLRPLKPEEMGSLEGRGVVLSECLPPGAERDAVVAVEFINLRADYVGAIRASSRKFADWARADAYSAGEALALEALRLGVDAARYSRFREICERAEMGTASSADAAFALFFLVDVALRRQNLI